MPEPETDYKQGYEDFWKELVENPDGTLDKDKVARELHDYRFLMKQAGQVYCHVTRGLISKTNTYALPIIQEHDRVCSDDEQEAAKEACRELRQKVEAVLEVKGLLNTPLGKEILDDIKEEA
jgi:hypothetical protein